MEEHAQSKHVQSEHAQSQHAQSQHTGVSDEAETAAMGGCLTRVGWLIAAPLGLLALGVSLAKNGNGPWGLESILYWFVVGLAVVVRYVDVVRHQGQTLQGEPASEKDWRRYAIALPLVALAAWSAAVWLA